MHGEGIEMSQGDYSTDCLHHVPLCRGVCVVDLILFLVLLRKAFGSYLNRLLHPLICPDLTSPVHCRVLESNVEYWSVLKIRLAPCVCRLAIVGW